MIEFNPVNLVNLHKGTFPLNHDCILKVRFIYDTGLKYQYFSCRSQDSGTLTLILSSVALISHVECVSVDNLNDIL